MGTDFAVGILGSDSELSTRDIQHRSDPGLTKKGALLKGGGDSLVWLVKVGAQETLVLFQPSIRLCQAPK